MANPNVRLPTSGLSKGGQPTALGGFDRFGGPGWDLGTVVAYDYNTGFYTVALDSGATAASVQRVVDSPTSGVLQPGTRVVVCTSLPRGPYIMGMLAGDHPTLSAPPTAWDSGTAPGDHAIRSMGGGAVGVTVDGKAYVAAGPAVGVFADSATETLHTVTTDAYTRTAMGSSGVARTERGPNAFWRYGTVYLDVGATGDLINLRIVNDSTGDNDFQAEVSPGGGFTLRAAGGFSRVVQGVDATSVLGDADEYVSGTKKITVDGAVTEDLGPLITTTASTEDTTAGKRTQVTMKDRFSMTIGSTRDVHIGSTRYEFASDVEWVVGDPRSSVPTPGSMQALINYVGDTHVVSVLPGTSFNVVTTGPGTVNLGVPGAAAPNPLGGHIVTAAPGVFSVTKYEPLAALIQTLLTWMDTHQHVSLGAPPTIPSSPIVSPLVAAMQSQTVKVGPL